MRIYFILLFISFFSCKEQTEKTAHPSSPVDTIPVAADTAIRSDLSGVHADDYDQTEEQTEPSQLLVRFQHFSLLMHDFAYSTDFFTEVHENDSHFNIDERDNSDYIETLVVTGDTLHLSESLFDIAIDNNLLEVVPENNTDKFKISYCYSSSVYELFEHLKLSSAEEQEVYKNRFYRKEQTPYISLPDSANVFFKLTTLQDGEQQAFYTNGRMSKTYYEKEMKRIRNKYGFRDTLIEYSGEGGSWYATLTKGGHLYGYDTGSYLIRIERYANNTLAETKYIAIYIAYGC